MSKRSNIRINPNGDSPRIHPSAYIDPAAQVIGNVRIEENVFVGPLAVIRADELGDDGRVQPIIVRPEVSIQDGVVIHCRGGSTVEIGAHSTIAHGTMIHGPCSIGKGCFLALRTVIYSATLESEVWVGIGSVIMRTTVPSHLMIPAGSVISSQADVSNFRVTNYKEQQYQQSIWKANRYLKAGYMELLHREG